MNKVFILTITFFFIFFNGSALPYENFIKYKIDNEIITNFDIDKEKRYLIMLNPSLKNLENKKIEELSHESILFEKIKKVELIKYFKLGENYDDPVLNSILKSLYKKVGTNSEEDFIKFIDQYELKIDWIKAKIEIETLWNNLIYSKYNKQISLDMPALEGELTQQIKKNNKIKKYFLSEILIEPKKDVNLEDLNLKIKDSIEKIGFHSTATIYSKSDTAKVGGKIGWIEENSLSISIIDEIKDLKINQFTNFIKLSNSYLILKIDNIEIVEKKVDFKKALQKKIMFEKNNQLALFSKIYFDKIKQSIKIDEK